MSQALRDARRYEEVMSAEISGIERPAFHLSPRTGWMNDPNGFSYYQGFYHLFYQYHPYDTRWGPMHWGHAVSRNLLQWPYKPVALAPDAPYDYMGVFSGSAEMLGDGRQLLMYTGVKGVDDTLHNIKPEQIQCIAFGNGEEYDKYEGNPVLTKKDLHEGLSSADFRDPKIWREVDGTYRVVIGACTADKDGRILMYKSKDGFKWEFVRVIAENNHRYGRMWECPDYFELDGRQVLLTSPQDMLPEGFEYHNGNGTLCLVGTRDSEDESFTEICNQAIDYGIDYYATQTILTSD